MPSPMASYRLYERFEGSKETKNEETSAAAPELSASGKGGTGDSGSEGNNRPEAKTVSSNDPQLLELKAIDTQVRAHESAHLAAGAGVVTGGASFSYTRGPDGNMYAVGGEVPIDTGEGSTPEETVQKAQQIRSAALAPADPSPQDYKVATMAIMMEQKARIEQMRELQAQIDGNRQYGVASQSAQAS